MLRCLQLHRRADPGPAGAGVKQGKFSDEWVDRTLEAASCRVEESWGSWPPGERRFGHGQKGRICGGSSSAIIAFFGQDRRRALAALASAP
jgi:hypothetical protein